MSGKTIIYLGVTVGSVIGGFVPELFHADVVSWWGFIFSTIGGIVGFWLAYRYVAE